MKKGIILSILLLNFFIPTKINAQAFAIDIITSSISVVQGGTVSLTVNGIPIGGFNSSIQLSVSNACFNAADIVFVPSIMNPPYIGQIQILNTDQYKPGTYKLVVKGSNGSVTDRDSVNVTILSNSFEQFYHHISWKFGIGGNFINDIEIDSQNNYWFSVCGYGLGGICKYNGTTVEGWYNGKHEVYDMCGALLSSVSDNLFPANCRGSVALEIDSLDNIWFYDGSVGKIVEFKPGTGVLFQSPTHAFTNSFVMQMKMKAKSFVNKQFYLTGDNGLSYFNGTSFTDYNTGNSLIPSNTCSDMDIDVSGAVWVATNAGLGKFYNNLWSVYNTSNSTIISNGVEAVKATQSGSVLFSTGSPNSLSKVTGTTFSVVVSNVCLADMHYDSKGNLWGISAPGNYSAIIKISPTLSVTNFNQGDLKYPSYVSHPYILNSIQFDKKDLLIAGASNVIYNHGDFLLQDTAGVSIGINELSSLDNAKSLSVYPNPTSHSIAFKNLQEGVYSLRIYNIYGSLISTKNITEESQVDISEQGAGIYFVELQKDESIFRTKFIKN